MSEYQFSASDLANIINSSPVGMLLVDKKGVIKFSNKKAQSIFAYTETELLELPVEHLLPDRYKTKHSQKLQSYIDKPSARAMGAGRVLPAKMKDGNESLVEIGLIPIQLRGKKLILVSTIEASNKILKVAAFHDPLTGLPNRNLFLEIGENLRNLAIRNQAKLTVMFVDLDWFKQVNDDYGHAIGDLVLIEVARILQKNLRKNDVVGRLGGDEFILCMYDIESKEVINKLTTKLIFQISTMKSINGNPINITASIGAVTALNPESISLNEMIKQSDRLMYKVKNSGKGKAINLELRSG